MALVEGHLADCPHCREYLRQMRLTIAMTRALNDDDVDADAGRRAGAPAPSLPQPDGLTRGGVRRAGVSDSRGWGSRVGNPRPTLIADCRAPGCHRRLSTCAARCRRFQVMKAVLRLVKSFSGPPEPGSR